MSDERMQATITFPGFDSVAPTTPCLPKEGLRLNMSDACSCSWCTSLHTAVLKAEEVDPEDWALPSTPPMTYAPTSKFWVDYGTITVNNTRTDWGAGRGAAVTFEKPFNDTPFCVMIDNAPDLYTRSITRYGFEVIGAFPESQFKWAAVGTEYKILSKSAPLDEGQKRQTEAAEDLLKSINPASDTAPQVGESWPKDTLHDAAKRVVEGAKDLVPQARQAVSDAAEKASAPATGKAARDNALGRALGSRMGAYGLYIR